MPETFFLSFCIRLSFFLSFLPLILIFFSILHFLIIYSIWSLSLFCFHMSSFVFSFCYSISVHHFLVPFLYFFLLCLSAHSLPAFLFPFPTLPYPILSCPSSLFLLFSVYWPLWKYFLTSFLFSFSIFYVLTFFNINLFIFSSVQSLSRVRLFATPWITALQASLSITR